MRTASEPVLGILNLPAGFLIVFAGDFFAALFLVVVLFPALELLRALLPGLVFFVMRVILHFGSENVKAESQACSMAAWVGGDDSQGREKRFPGAKKNSLSR
jgi:predicted short-subunit dehydrogenase-like oxidoreductase (DUF2520 family)